MAKEILIPGMPVPPGEPSTLDRAQQSGFLDPSNLAQSPGVASNIERISLHFSGPGAPFAPVPGAAAVAYAGFASPVPMRQFLWSFTFSGTFGITFGINDVVRFRKAKFNFLSTGAPAAFGQLQVTQNNNFSLEVDHGGIPVYGQTIADSNAQYLGLGSQDFYGTDGGDFAVPGLNPIDGWQLILFAALIGAAGSIAVGLCEIQLDIFRGAKPIP